MKTNGPGQSSLLLLDVVNILNDSNTPYAVIGAFAASFFGVIRASLDVDAIISLTGDSEQLINKFQKVGLDIDQRRGDIDDPIAGVINVRDSYNNRVDLLLGIRGMSPDVFSRTVEASFNDSQVQIVGLEDFIAMKVFAGSPKDIADVQGALEVSKEKIDFDLLKELTSKYGKNELNTLNTMLESL